MAKKKKKKKSGFSPKTKSIIKCVVYELIFLSIALFVLWGAWPFDWGQELIEATIVVEDTEYDYIFSKRLKNSNSLYYNSEEYHLFKPFSEDTFKVGDELSIVYVVPSFPFFDSDKLISAVSSADKTYLKLEDTLHNRRMAFVGMIVIVSILQAMFFILLSKYFPYYTRKERKRKKQKYKKKMAKKKLREKMAKEKLEEDSDKKLGDGSHP